jgi:hypothetical protein
MNDERWRSLMNNPDSRLTMEEMVQGWHWCFEFDELLVGPPMEMEWSVCTCFTPEEKLSYADPSRQDD